MDYSTTPLRRYSYPDTGDLLTAEMIRIREPYEGYWAASERHVLDLALAELSRVVAGLESPRMLDAGAGDGRLLAMFEPLFEALTVVEPDRARLGRAEEIATAAGFGRKVRFVNQKAETLDDTEPYDFILCSHVLQHVHTDSVAPMLRRFAELLSATGRLLILTTHSTRSHDYFVEAGLQDGQLLERQIDQARFNLLTRNQDGLLPIRFLTRDSIYGLLSDAGLSALQFRCFHILSRQKNLPSGIERDHFVNASSSRQEEFGRDMYVMTALRHRR